MKINNTAILKKAHKLTKQYKAKFEGKTYSQVFGLFSSLLFKMKREERNRLTAPQVIQQARGSRSVLISGSVQGTCIQNQLFNEWQLGCRLEFQTGNMGESNSILNVMKAHTGKGLKAQYNLPEVLQTITGRKSITVLAASFSGDMNDERVAQYHNWRKMITVFSEDTTFQKQYQ